MLNNVELQYKGLRILSRYCSCQDSEFWSAIETSSVDIDKLQSKNFFLWIQCPKISLLLFKDVADLRMESFSCKQSPHTLLLGANGFTKEAEFLDIVSIGKSSCLATSQCQLMRSPLLTETLESWQEQYRLSILKPLYLNIYVSEWHKDVWI